MKTKPKEKEPQSNEDIVHQYFGFIQNKDIAGLLDLFDYDAIIYEPFSKVTGLHGKSAIAPFLKVAMMANSNMKRTIAIEKQRQQQGNSNPDPQNKITALITFEKGDKVKGKFTFEIAQVETGEKKIKSLNIEFLA